MLILNVKILFCVLFFHFNDLATIVIIVFHIFFTQRNEREDE